ncbi:hypothetical protein BVRB_9g225420 [Beta vulgaris subsp. vulgaris]|uniref:Uncharacterized protein n=1 Tax=Beta vulgaris subsp. vulgaris TaxID=3555 RepID=A0A0J8DZW0_BETVV|nr:hypothetical protein BVRB_9g225420 [Beta vulgaris subsp. vulgaris]
MIEFGEETDSQDGEISSQDGEELILGLLLLEFCFLFVFLWLSFLYAGWLAYDRPNLGEPFLEGGPRKGIDADYASLPGWFGYKLLVFMFPYLDV